MGRWVGKYCPDCEDVVESCGHAEERDRKKVRGPAIAVRFQPHFNNTVGAYVGSKKQLFEIAARKGIKLGVEQIP